MVQSKLVRRMSKQLFISAFVLILGIPFVMREGGPGILISSGKTMVGIASYYGKAFAGKKTASGDIFHPGEFTAAHRTLPLRTRVRVTNLENNISVLVEITDRGPYKYDRVIDLSSAAARTLGFKKDGLARVRIEVLEAAENLRR